MKGLTDQQLLRDYAERRSESAFAELVRWHVDLIYSVALLQIRSPQFDEEVSRSAFIDLARSAARMKLAPF